MRNKVLALLLILVGACGKDVEISNRELQYNSSLSTPTAEQDGILIRGKPDRLKGPSGTYPVSIYSSYSSLEFIAARELNQQYPVKFRGKIKNGQYVVETLSAK